MFIVTYRVVKGNRAKIGQVPSGYTSACADRKTRMIGTSSNLLLLTQTNIMVECEEKALNDEQIKQAKAHETVGGEELRT